MPGVPPDEDQNERSPVGLLPSIILATFVVAAFWVAAWIILGALGA